MNSAYVIAAILTALAAGIATAGARTFDDDPALGDRLLAGAVGLIMAAAVFAGAGVNIQYYQ